MYGSTDAWKMCIGSCFGGCFNFVKSSITSVTVRGPGGMGASSFGRAGMYERFGSEKSSAIRKPDAFTCGASGAGGEHWPRSAYLRRPRGDLDLVGRGARGRWWWRWWWCRFARLLRGRRGHVHCSASGLDGLATVRRTVFFLDTLRLASPLLVVLLVVQRGFQQRAGHSSVMRRHGQHAHLFFGGREVDAACKATEDVEATGVLAFVPAGWSRVRSMTSEVAVERREYPQKWVDRASKQLADNRVEHATKRS